MRFLKKPFRTFFGVLIGLGVFLFFVSSVHAGIITDPHLFGSKLELHINDNGKVSVEGIRVEQTAGGTYYGKMYWGDSFVRVTVRTDAQTVFTKKFGEPITSSEVSTGDFISVEGDLFSGDTTLTVLAKNLKDWSIQTQEDQFSGSVSSVSGDGIITLATDKMGTISMVSATTSVITKGSLTISWADIKPGDKMTSVSGVFDHFNRTLTARTARIYQDMSLFKARNFQGVLKVGSNSKPPTSLVVTINDKDYTINLIANAEILNNKRKKADLGRFLSGDRVRIYGSIKEASQSTIESDLVRNLDL